MDNATPLKGALHTHSTCSDGGLAPLEVLRVYRDLGFDFVALTDHDFLMKPGAYADIPDEFEGMLVYKGVEKTVFARGYVHVNVIPGRNTVLHIFNHPAEYDLSPEQVIQRIEVVQGMMPLDAVEVTSKGFYTAEYDTEEIALPKVASDDSHTRDMCGRAWVTAPCERDHDAILTAIKAGLAQVYYRGTARRQVWTPQG